MRGSRLLTILISLQVHGRVTAAALAERLEVSKRTIYRDVDELSAAGVPIYADRGPTGGFALLDGYRTELTGLTPDESEALFMAGLPAAAADLGLANAASAARLKLLAALSPKGRTDAARIADRFHIDVDAWYRRSAPPPFLREVAAAVWSERRLRIDYESWRGRSWRTLDPLGIVLKAGEWYLIAASRGRQATYRLAAIRALEPLPDAIERPAGFDLAEAWRANVARFERDLETAEAVIRVSPAAMSRLDRLGARVAERVRAAPETPGGWREATVPIEGIDFAAGLLLGFADAIEVVSPPALRRAVAAQAERTIALYRGDGGDGRVRSGQ